MLEFFQVTAQYSNAVLVAILPYVSDFSHRLNLPTPTPITTKQVARFQCDPRNGAIGGVVTLTNGLVFAFIDGRVSSYRSPQSYFCLQDPERIPQFYGRVKLTEKEAFKVARGTVDKLGYTADVFQADLQPKVDLPKKIGNNYVARYRFRWRDPAKTSPVKGLFLSLLDVEVDATTGQIRMLSMAKWAGQRPSPSVAVASPPLAAKQPGRKLLSGGMPTLPVSDAYAAAFLQAILPQMSEYAVKAHLTSTQPVTTNDIDLGRYSCRLWNDHVIAQVYLKNGDRFNYDHGRVAAFYAHDAYRKFPENGRLEDFTGKWNMTTNEAIALCEQVIRDLGYKAHLPKGALGSPLRIYGVEPSRCVFYWWRRGEDGDFASFEVDMESKTIKSAYLEDASLWRDPPKIAVSLSLKTNTPTSKQ